MRKNANSYLLLKIIPENIKDQKVAIIRIEEMITLITYASLAIMSPKIHTEQFSHRDNIAPQASNNLHYIELDSNKINYTYNKENKIEKIEHSIINTQSKITTENPNYNLGGAFSPSKFNLSDVEGSSKISQSIIETPSRIENTQFTQSQNFSPAAQMDQSSIKSGENFGPEYALPPRPNAQKGWSRTLTRAEIAYQALALIDMAQTLECLNRSNCVEANPIIGKSPSKEKLVGYLVGGSLLQYWWVRRLARRDIKSAKIMLFGMIAMRGVVVGLNFKVLNKTAR